MYKYHGIFWDAKYIHFNSRRFWNWWFILVNLLRWSLHASLLADGPGQVALDIWFVSCCLIVRFCVFFSLFYMYVFACLFCLRFSCVFVMVESACQRARRWSWTGGSWYLVCLFLFLVFVCECFSFCVFSCVHALACVGLLVLLVESESLFAGRWFWSDCVSWLPWGDLYSWLNERLLSSEFEHSICLFLLGSDCHYQNSTWITNTWGKWSPLPSPPPYHSTLDAHSPLERWTLWE